MPSITQMKSQLYTAYPLSRCWKKKVDQMSTSQIIAVWHSFQKRKESHKSKWNKKEIQLTLFDLNNF